MKELRNIIKNSHLTKTQMIIANYILDNFSEACFMTSTDISLKLGVSESSVIRFCRSLGYNGFMDFQKTLRKSYQDQVSNISSSITVPAERIAKRSKLDPSSDYINKHFKNAAANLESALTNNLQSSYEEAANIIIKSRAKYIVASRGNTCLGDYLLLLLKHMVPHVSSTSYGAITPIDHMCNMTKDDCVIAFSFPRYSSMDKLALEHASNVGAKIIVITDKQSALLAQYATVLFTVSVDNNTFFNSFVGAEFVMELLAETISHNVTGIEKRLKTIDKYIGELGVY